MEFFIYFPTEQVAREAQERIRKDYPDSKVDVQPAQETDEYLCTTTMLVDRSTIEAVTILDEYFERIADELEGDFDGSGTFLE